MSDFHDSDDDGLEPTSPSLRPRPCASPCKRMMQHHHPGGPLSLPKKWELLIKGEDDLPDFTVEEIRDGIGVLLRRVSKYEEDAKADRAAFQKLHTEHLNLLYKVQAMDTAWKQSLKDLARLPDAPSYTDIMEVANAEPRRMTQWELWNMHSALTKLSGGGKLAQDISRIMDVQPSDGHVHWNFAQLPARKQWQGFYHIMFHGTKFKKSPTARSKQSQAEIIDAGDIKSTSFEGLSLRSEDDGEVAFCEDDDANDIDAIGVM